LALSQAIAQLHGGSVRLEESTGQITRFTVDLP
jgi:signal transduction histidine kinase